MRPDVGTQAQFKKPRPPHTYRYETSLSPQLAWDGQNSAAREEAETLIRRTLAAAAAEQDLVRRIADSASLADMRASVEQLQVLQQETRIAADGLRAMSRPFLDCAGKAERLSFDVPTLPLFIHERLSTEAIIETLRGHKQQLSMDDLFGDPRHSITEQVLGAYTYRDQWVNRMILGDSLVAMNSLLHYESLGGQVQMIYMDPPYGVRFGSNFQPFVRKRDVSHNEDESMTREPEMVQAYRDTWELGLHSYLTYLFHPAAIERFVMAKVGEDSATQHIADLTRHFEDNFQPAFLRDPLGDYGFLKGTKARKDLLPPALLAAGLPEIQYTEYSEIAALMRPEEIHPEVVEKLDAIQKAFGL